MAETNQHLLRLGRGYNGFYCPETRLHLMGGIKPQDVIPADIPLSENIKRGLRGGTIIDANQTIPIKEILTEKQLERYLEEHPEEIIGDEVKTNDIPADEAPSEKEEDIEEITVDDKDDVELPSPDFDAMTKAELQQFIKDNDIDAQELGLNSRSNAGDYKDALEKYFTEKA